VGHVIHPKSRVENSSTTPDNTEVGGVACSLTPSLHVPGPDAKAVVSTEIGQYLELVLLLQVVMRGGTVEFTRKGQSG